MGFPIALSLVLSWVVPPGPVSGTVWGTLGPVLGPVWEGLLDRTRGTLPNPDRTRG